VGRRVCGADGAGGTLSCAELAASRGRRSPPAAPAVTHLPLIREVPEEGAPGEPGGVGDLGDGVVVPRLDEQVERGGDQALPRLRNA